ncbi:MAG: cation-translocating P-type ATPase, partial [Mycobacteriaceae bacterium]|nr:cation-translocating P-type ATPase [Mycobacteriaceae bacterium]
MRVPGVATAVSGMTSGAARAVRAGVHSAAGATLMLTSPVVRSVGQSTGLLLGPTSTSDTDAAPSVAWHTGRRTHLDLDQLSPFPRWHQHVAAVEETVGRIPGVARAHVEGALGRLVLEHEDTVDHERIWDTVREAVAVAAAKSESAGPEVKPTTVPFADPGDPLAILVPLTAAAMDVAAVAAAVTGLFGRLPAAPRAAQAAAAVINYQPRVVSLLESWLG